VYTKAALDWLDEVLTCVVILAAERNKEFAAGRNIFEEEGDASVKVSDFCLEMEESDDS